MRTVVLILDDAFGNRLESVAQSAPVWILDTPANRGIVERLWADGESGDGPTDITLFNGPFDRHDGASWRGTLSVLERHFDPLSERHGMLEVVVYGAPASDEARRGLCEFGFDEIEDSSDGFVARRGQAA